MNENFCFKTSCSLLIIMYYFLCHVWYHKDLLQLDVSVWFVVDSRQPANNKAGCMGHIHQHSRVTSQCVFFFVLFLFLLFCFLSGCICVCVCVYIFNCIVLFRCHYGVMKHDDDCIYNFFLNMCGNIWF